jgi:hypothetical protein
MRHAEASGSLLKAVLRNLMDLLAPLIVDSAIFAFASFALYFAQFALVLLKRLGYGEARTNMIETVHYYTTLTIFFVYEIDLLFKVTIAMFFRDRHRWLTRPPDRES